MVGHLSELLDEFPAASNQTRCFAHTISLSAKAILKQFDVLKAKDSEALDEAAQALADLAIDIDIEELETLAMNNDEGGKDDEPLDSWIDFCEGMTAEQKEE